MNFRYIFRALVYRIAWPLVSLMGGKLKFALVYKLNLWGNGESASGDGSTLAYTGQLRVRLPALFADYQVHTVLDAPCGDYHWFRHVPRSGICYIGGDIVRALVTDNQTRYGSAETRFVTLDIRTDALPQADLWICRDCTFHLPTRDVIRTFLNFAKSNIPYILTTSHQEVRENVELPKSGFRLMNLQLPPYSFPEPLVAIEDWIPGFPRRILGLWTREDVKDALARTAPRRKA